MVISYVSLTEVLALEKKCLVVKVVPVKYLVSRQLISIMQRSLKKTNP